MNNDLPESILGKRLEEEAAQLTPAPSGLWERVQAKRSKKTFPKRVFALALAASAAVICFLIFRPRPLASIWQLEGRALRVGEEIKTARSARTLTSTLGTVTLEPGSQLRVTRSRPERQQLALDQGAITVKVTAPPRLFAVETPRALAVDLGCAYKLSVAGQSSALDVSVGWVELEDKQGASVLVPAGGHLRVSSNGKLSLPWYGESGERPKALEAYESGGPLEPLLAALHEPVDTLTLFHLLPRVSGAEREATLEKMLTFTTLPGSVTREQVLALDKKALATWREELKLLWGGAAQLGI
ncbi:FecR domain-containing protein [Armatimonas sp.]|uniref:FecR domain-containing protein n=1 Tax=Armatimonas sp. TaxID=1872638 RepID=UPI00286AC9FC|nr:FecR domain-containing protein [Armatimonas sp.]